MNIQVKKAISTVHAVVMWVAFLVTVASLSVFVYEKSKSFEDYVKYFHVIPYATEYNAGDDIRFYSFYESYVTVDISWGETVWCDSGEGFVHTDTASTSEEDFLAVRKYPNRIKSLMIEIYNKNHEASLYTEQILRDYALSTQAEGADLEKPFVMRPWKLNIDKPQVNSICYTRHKIKINTPYFKLEKTYELFSSPWEYNGA